MSTDDLTEALRIAGQARGFADPSRSERAIIALADEVDRLRADRDECAMQWRDAHDMFGAVRDERDAARAALERGDASDGYHTHNELYEYRMLYNAHAAHGWLAAGIPVVKSWKHSDGELAFGGGWFIVVATLPTGQASNHYQAEHWGLFQVPEVDLPPEYDGHTPADASNRLRAALRAT